MPDDRRILAALILLGLAAVVRPTVAVAQHIADLWRWHVDAEPIVMDTQRNGGVRVDLLLDGKRIGSAVRR